MPRRKKNTAYSTHEYAVSKMTPTGQQLAITLVIGSRDAFHKQTEIENEGFLTIVRNLTLDSEDYRTPGLDKSIVQITTELTAPEISTQNS